MIPKRPPLDRDAAAAAAARFAILAEPDVAYALVDTPVGKVMAAQTRRGLACLGYVDKHGNADHFVEELSTSLSPRILEAPARLDVVRRELDEYFEGKRRRFDLPLDVAMLADFNRRVLRELARVPYGHVVTYGELAARAARPRAARAVGTVMNRNPLPIVLPCHRVIGANGKLVGYGGGLERKEALLRLEGALL
jgi:methylated-DNA-[protein]-cysteine S-methyltransferase